MKKLFAIITVLILLNQPAMSLNSGTFAIEHQTNREEISYKLPITEEFKKTFLDSLKTGEIVTVSHSVKIRPVDQWFGWMSQKNYIQYFKYNLISNQYYIGTSKTNLTPLPSIKSLLDNVTSLNNAPFLPKNILESGKAYEIDFSITINPNNSKENKLLLFKGDGLKERLHSAVHYIDK